MTKPVDHPCDTCSHQGVDHRMTMDLMDPSKAIEILECLRSRCECCRFVNVETGHA